MIDFHNHLIPKIDDGAKSFEMAFKMVQKAYHDNTDCIVNTVHLNHPTVKNSDFETIAKRKKELENMLEKENINIEIISAAEVYFDSNLLELSQQPIATVKNKFMLIEFNPNFLPPIIDDVFFQLKCNGIYPIIAHPERYRFVQNDISIVKKWINKDYFIQLNAGSIMGFAGKMMQKTAFSLLKNEYCHLVGSDAHNNQNLNFCLKDSLAKIDRKFGSDCVEIINQNSTKLLNGEDLIPIKSLVKKKYWFF
jgi:protein-tyrosine phosphatase